MVRLRVTVGDVVSEYEPDTTVSVGRAGECDLVVDDARVSRRHLTIECVNEVWVVRDSSSTGTYVAGQRITEASIPHDVEFRLGSPDGPAIALSPVETSHRAAPPSPSAEQPPAPSPPDYDATARWGTSTVGLDDRALRLSVGDESVHAFPPGSDVLVGRDQAAQVFVDDELVSRRHARFFSTPSGGWRVEDLGSTRGTFVDGRKINKPEPVEGAFAIWLGEPGAGAELSVVTAGVHKTPVRRGPWLLAGAAVVLALVAAAAAAALWARSDGPTEVPAAELAQSVVFVIAETPDGEPCASGSGSVVSEDGLILTNWHVVADLFNKGCQFRGNVAYAPVVGDEVSEQFSADVVAADRDLDLAVLRASEPWPELPALALGDSEDLTVDTELRIIGFPGTGGQTLTVTEGNVAGFLAQQGIDEKAWIKTAAGISGGNSGGAAVNAAGELVGVPTRVFEPDCRPIDKNRDGELDDAELADCTSFGGFLNGIRPIRFAIPLLSQARTSSPISPDDPALKSDAPERQASEGLEVVVVGLDANDDVVEPSPDLPANTAALGGTYVAPEADAARTVELAVNFNGTEVGRDTRELVAGATEGSFSWRPTTGVLRPGSYTVTVTIDTDTATASVVVR